MQTVQLVFLSGKERSLFSPQICNFCLGFRHAGSQIPSVVCLIPLVSPKTLLPNQHHDAPILWHPFSIFYAQGQSTMVAYPILSAKPGPAFSPGPLYIPSIHRMLCAPCLCAFAMRYLQVTSHSHSESQQGHTENFGGCRSSWPGWWRRRRSRT